MARVGPRGKAQEFLPNLVLNQIGRAARILSLTHILPPAGSIAKLFRQNPFVEVVTGIEHHVEIDVGRLADFDLYD